MTSATAPLVILLLSLSLPADCCCTSGVATHATAIATHAHEEKEKGNNFRVAGLGGTTGKGMVFAVALALGVAALGVPGAH